MNKPPNPGVGCEVVNVTVDAGLWSYGIPDGIMTQSDMSYRCNRTCWDDTNDDFTLSVRYAMVAKKYDEPKEEDLTAIGTSGQKLA